VGDIFSRGNNGNNGNILQSVVNCAIAAIKKYFFFFLNGNNGNNGNIVILLTNN